MDTLHHDRWFDGALVARLIRLCVPSVLPFRILVTHDCPKPRFDAYGATVWTVAATGIRADGPLALAADLTPPGGTDEASDQETGPSPDSTAT